MLRRDVAPVVAALGEWATCAAINQYLGTALLPPDLQQWSDDERAIVLALAERANGTSKESRGDDKS